MSRSYHQHNKIALWRYPLDAAESFCDLLADKAHLCDPRSNGKPRLLLLGFSALRWVMIGKVNSDLHLRDREISCKQEASCKQKSVLVPAGLCRVGRHVGSIRANQNSVIRLLEDAGILDALRHLCTGCTGASVSAGLLKRKFDESLTGQCWSAT